MSQGLLMDGCDRKYRALKEQIKAVVLFCSDPRFVLAHREFIENGLGLLPGTYAPITAAGGAGILCRPPNKALESDGEFEFVRRRLILHCKHCPTIRRLILISHEDCGYYKMMAEKLKKIYETTFNISNWTRKDLAGILQTTSGLLLMLEAFLGNGTSEPFSVECYMAQFTDREQTEIEFQKF